MVGRRVTAVEDCGKVGAMTTSDTNVTVSRIIDAPAKDIFALLTLPAKHPSFDGSGSVRSAEDTERITKSGEKFVMNMHREDQGGDYRIHNHVTAFDENKMVGWQPANDDAPDAPKGWEWLYELRAQDASTTEVVLTYSWDKVTDKKVLEKVGFPLITEAELEQSLNLLAAAVSEA